MRESIFPDLYKRIGIYGVGLLGGSLGMALKAVNPDFTIIGIGRSAERLEEARRREAIDTYTCDPANINPPLDFLIICTPVRKVTEHLLQTLPSLKKGALVTDVGSTKTLVVNQCEKHGGNTIKFVGSHPMAGSHKTGVKAAIKDLYKKKICVVTQTERTNPTALEAVCSLWQLVGMRVVRMSPDLHDRLTARSSHLPHLVAASLCHVANNMESDITSVLGNGFRDTTRIAAGDPGMWMDICLENRDEILAAVDSMLSILHDLRQQIAMEDEHAIFQFLEQAQQWKKSV